MVYLRIISTRESSLLSVLTFYDYQKYDALSSPRVLFINLLSELVVGVRCKVILPPVPVLLGVVPDASPLVAFRRRHLLRGRCLGNVDQCKIGGQEELRLHERPVLRLVMPISGLPHLLHGRVITEVHVTAAPRPLTFLSKAETCRAIRILVEGSMLIISLIVLFQGGRRIDDHLSQSSQL